MATTAGARFLAHERMPQEPEQPFRHESAVAPLWEAARMTDETREYLVDLLKRKAA